MWQQKSTIRKLYAFHDTVNRVVLCNIALDETLYVNVIGEIIREIFEFFITDLGNCRVLVDSGPMN